MYIFIYDLNLIISSKVIEILTIHYFLNNDNELLVIFYKLDVYDDIEINLISI